MEVQFKLNTEKEDIKELKKLQTWLNELIEKRENNANARAEVQKNTPEEKPAVQEEKKPQATEQKKEYSGHGRIVDYEDLSGTMSKIYSGK